MSIGRPESCAVISVFETDVPQLAKSGHVDANGEFCGATLAAEAAAGLIDEYRARGYPVLVGGGIPFFPQRERPVDLELVETRTCISRVVYFRYRVAR